MTGQRTTPEMMMIGRRARGALLRALLALVMIAFVLPTIPAAAKEKRSPSVIELEGIDVIGKVAKPQVFYVLGRSTVRYEQLKFDQSFVQRIVETARKNPF